MLDWLFVSHLWTAVLQQERTGANNSCTSVQASDSVEVREASRSKAFTI